MRKEKPKSKQNKSNSERNNIFPIVDLFAGPGGLGEGFASAINDDGEEYFRSVISIECDSDSHRTLTLRHFFRQFPNGEAPDEYYDFLAKRITLEELFAGYPIEYEEARRSALQIKLGADSHPMVRDLINSRIADRKRWALIGGPPCQAYSLVGRSRMMGKPGFENDERHTLYLEYLRVIADHRPPIFVMENVKGLLSATIKGKSAIQKIVNDLSEPARAISNVSSDLTYNLYSLSEEEIAEGEIDPRMFIVRAEEYGVPQARHRMFIVGIRGDIKVRPRTLKKIAAPTVREMIGSLPAIRSGITKEKDSFENWKEAVHGIAKLNIHRQLKGTPFADSVSSKLSKDALGEMKHPQTRSSTRYSSNVPKLQLLQRLYDGRLKVLTSHEARGHKRSDLQRYLFISTFANETGRSPRLVDFPKVLLPEHKNVELGRKGEMFADRFKVQLPNSVSNTITSHISKDGHYFIHYDPAQCRSLTVREAARLQTFPDNYCFLGERTSQFHQVGNAVPPQLAKQIAVIVAEVLEAMPRR